MTRRLQISVCGASSSDGGLDAAAEAVGRGIAEAGAVVVCGGLTGVMTAAARGAAAAGGEVIGIVPSSAPEDANEHCTHVVAAGVGEARNLAVVSSGDAVIAIGGEWGTLSEVALARRLGRPVVTLDSWSASGRGGMDGGPGIEPAGDPAEAVALALARAEYPS